ncbi:hypothetical protein MSAN_00869700 [Mycena sanguinolenta]|uniref:Uncharacterized protein n=1 Tax=Mycena sanguinolenta TaxID=230812 RepID=A0A8H7DDF4_9AGAR|nr:hypothetical protein MSAN_00869700 [Mycena sanguinolenta]
MARRRNRAARNASSSSNACCIPLAIVVLAGIIAGVVIIIQDTIATQRELRSKITDDTPISGFYGPGAWWAWLITLGMTHGHSFLAMAESREEWDYDLFAASGYIIAAAIDLISKGRAIARLGDAASESPLLPALLCAERVVSVGTGSSLFTIITASIFHGSAGRRRAAIALVPLIFALVASWFTLRAHQEIFQTFPVLWCRLHDGSTLRKREDIPFTLVDFPASLVDLIGVVPQFYVSPGYWVFAGALSGMVSFVALLASLARRDNRMAVLHSTAWGLVPLAGASALPLLGLGYLIGFATFKWLVYWVILWAPIYVLAFFPQMGYFPLTGMSVMDMDQITALLSVAFIAAFRTGRRIFEAVPHSGKGPGSTQELEPLVLPSPSMGGG